MKNLIRSTPFKVAAFLLCVLFTEAAVLSGVLAYAMMAGGAYDMSREEIFGMIDRMDPAAAAVSRLAYGLRYAAYPVGGAALLLGIVCFVKTW